MILAPPRVLFVLSAALTALAVAAPGGIPVAVEESALEATAVPVTTASGVALHGRVVVSQGFTIGTAVLAVAAAPGGALGTPHAPVALASLPAPARTDVARDHWTLTVPVASETGGNASYDVSLAWNGEERGVVRLLDREGGAARVTFDLGSTIATSSTFVIAIQAVHETGTVRVELRLESAPEGTLRWRSAEDGALDPAIEARAGDALRLAWTNRDGVPHNLVLRDAGGRAVAGPTRIVDAVGESATLEWTAVAGEYAYVCALHASTMRGVLRVVLPA